MKALNKAALAAVALLASSAASAGPILDGGFEAQGATTGTSYCYFGFASAGGAACAAGSWSGTAGAGLQYEANGAWPGSPSPDGSYYGFIQGSGSLSQTFSVGATTTFSLGWLDAGRPRGAPNDGDQNYSVTLTGSNGVATLFTGGTSSFQGFGGHSTGSFVLAADTYTLSFNGLTTTGDHTSFIDGVSLQAAVPEPATWAMLIVGFGAIGGMVRRRRRPLVPTYA